MIVSQPPVITQATRPAYESGPTLFKMSCKTIYDPLPDIARRNMRGKSSEGISRILKIGEKILSIRFKIPDAVRLFTAIKIPIRYGSISIEVLRPCFAPSIK